MSPNPATAVMAKGGKVTGKTKGLDVKKFTEDVLGDAAKYQEHIEMIHGGQEALQAQAEKNQWSIEEQYQYAHGLQEEEAQKNGVSVQAHYEKQIAALKAQEEQLQGALNKTISKSSGSEESDSEAAKEMEVSKEKNEEAQEAEVQRVKQIQDVKSRFDNLKAQLKQKYEDKVRTAQTDPPKYSFFSGNGFFFLMAGADFAVSAIPYIGFVFQKVIFIVAMVGWLIPCILLRSPLSILPIFIFYLIDYGTSVIAALIPIPVVGAVMDLIPEIMSRKLKMAPNQIIARAEERFVEIKIHELEDKFRAAMHNLDQRYQRAIKRVNNLFNKARFMMPSYDVEPLAQHIVTGFMLFLAAVLTWYKVIGISFDAINITQLLLTGFFLIVAFFMQKVGLIPVE